MRAAPPPTKLSLTEARKVHATVFFVYMASMFAVTFPVPSIGVIQANLGLTTGQVATLGASQTLGLALGKVLSGWVVDSFGPRRTLTWGFSLVFVSVVGVCSAQSVQQLSAGLFLTQFTNAVAWPCCSILIGTYFRSDPQQLDTGFWVLSLSSRIWGMASIGFFAALLYSYHWRVVGLVSSAFAGVGVLLTRLFVRDSPSQACAPVRRISPASTLRSAGRFLGTPRFWLVVTAHTFTATVRRAEGILAPFLADTTDLTEEQAGLATIVFSLGYVIGLLALGPVYSRAGPARKIAMVQGLYAVCIASHVGLVASAGDGRWAAGLAGQVGKAALLALLSLTTALQFFIIPFVYAIQAGGQSTGTLTSCIDGFGVGASSLFFVVAGYVVDSAWGWRGVWAILLALGLVGSAAMVAFLRSFLLAEGAATSPTDGQRKKSQ